MIMLTSDDRWHNKEDIQLDVIRQLRETGSAIINAAPEGPDLSVVGLYDWLDKLSVLYGFNKSNITIRTANKVESHLEYKIEFTKFVWLSETITEFKKKGLDKESFYSKKSAGLLSLFGSFNNRPTWYRLCLVMHLFNNHMDRSIVTLRTTDEKSTSNTISYDKLHNEVPTEKFYQVIEFIRNSCPLTLPVRSLTYTKGFADTITDLTHFYNDFFIDVVANTFTAGNTFYMDEKMARPILCSTPFIVYGPCGYLRNMRDQMGFKTFGQWWDESYDEYSGYERVTRIQTLIDSLSTLGSFELQTIYGEMLPTLEHNYHQLYKVTSRNV